MVKRHHLAELVSVQYFVLNIYQNVNPQIWKCRWIGGSLFLDHDSGLVRAQIVLKGKLGLPLHEQAQLCLAVVAATLRTGFSRKFRLFDNKPVNQRPQEWESRFCCLRNVSVSGSAGPV